MARRDGFEAIDGGRADDDPTSQDDQDALAALTGILGGPPAAADPELHQRAAELAVEIMGMPDEVRHRPPRGD